MIFKSFVVEKNISLLDSCYAVLFYGENIGLKDDLKNFIKNYNKDCEQISFHQNEPVGDHNRLNIYSIHIQNPKVNFNNFDTIVAPDHDGISGSNIITSRGSIHYLTLEEINKSRFYLEKNIEKNKDIITLILGGPNKYYNYSEENIKNILYRINDYIDKYNLQLIVIPSNRTPKKIINTIKNIRSNYLIVDKVDKQAYLSSLSLSKYIVVTCDSTSMISEAALTGKPIYVAMIPATKNDYRFKKFRDLFKELNIIRELGDSLEIWDYEKLDETNRIAQEIKKKLS